MKSVRQMVGSLSGGQRQAVAVARAVMRDSKLVIMDEPTAALGVTQTAQVLDLIKTLASRGIAVLVISHNLTDVFEVADRVAVMYLGTLVCSGPGRTTTPRACRRPHHHRHDVSCPLAVTRPPNHRKVISLSAPSGTDPGRHRKRSYSGAHCVINRRALGADSGTRARRARPRRSRPLLSFS